MVSNGFSTLNAYDKKLVFLTLPDHTNLEEEFECEKIKKEIEDRFRKRKGCNVCD